MLQSYSKKIQGWFAGDILNVNNIRLYAPTETVDPWLKGHIIQGSYESAERSLINNYFPTNTDIIELGAGIGYISCVANNTKNEHHTHVAVEPNKQLISLLERTRDLNNSDYEIMSAAYSPDSDTVNLTVQERFWGGSPHNTKGKHSMTVDSTNIKQLCELYNLDTFSLICDIEASEVDLIESELETLENHCQFMLIEWHDNKPRFEDLHDRIQRARSTLETSFDKITSSSNVVAYSNPRFD
ncbi:FkbM family methyltransferase [Halorubrum sp. JWXQ-INN 858]|uniref:FkbM family methyltransferase n=1 Tax=Halorubrum sp. JWXQ-INN 858 TaxID=2690782 RepID=UPI0013595808|nr:FkbM family methyltransferase [Halorubrum sp. JWXQ-INN 858]MWV65237.1 FkbM family methyltransferase [Halorubrum sp. JWXQ-INN 858]